MIDCYGPVSISCTVIAPLYPFLTGGVVFFFFLSALRFYAVSSEYATDLQQATTAVAVFGPTILDEEATFCEHITEQAAREHTPTYYATHH